MSSEKDEFPEYEYFARTLAESQPALAHEVGSFTGISAVLLWMKARQLERTQVDIVGQDEFHYDFLILLGPGQWLAFGVT